MNLMSIVSIIEDRKERKTINASIKSAIKREYGFSIYESMEYVRNNLGKNSINLQIEMMKSFIR